MRKLLDFPTPEYSEGPSKIFGSKDSTQRTPILPMSLLPVEEINNRWTELEKKVAGNPSENGERLLSAPFNTDTFVPYTRPLIKFYRSTSSEFTISAPNCQNFFRSICSKSFTSPTISVPTTVHYHGGSKQGKCANAGMCQHVHQNHREVCYQYGGLDANLPWFSG